MRLFSRNQLFVLAFAGVLALGSIVAAAIPAIRGSGFQVDLNTSATGIIASGKAGLWGKSSDGLPYWRKTDGSDVSMSGGGGAAYSTIADEGSDLTQRSKVNFIGSMISCADNAGATRTDCTLTAPTVYNQTIEDEGTPLTQRSNVNFTGAGISCSDSGGKTVCDVSSGGGTTQTIDVINATAATAKTITSAAADTGSNVGTTISNSTALTGSRVVLRVDNAGTPNVDFKGDGSVIMKIGSGQRMCAPAGANCFQYYDSVLLVEGVGIRPSTTGEINGSAGTQAWAEVGSRIYSTDVPTTKTFTSNTLAPTHYITHVNDSGLLKTITPPTFGFNGELILIPDQAFTWDATGNIDAGTGTAVVKTPIIAVYDANTTKWYFKP